MLTRRVIACLDVRGERVVKGTQFIGLRDVGDPCELAVRYEHQGADEIVFLDISATPEERASLLDVARRTAERLFIPLTIGGGIRSAADAAAALRAGADKISMNSAIVARPELLTECADRFGAQCVVASIDARRTPEPVLGSPSSPPRPEPLAYHVVTHGGRNPTDRDAVGWALECVRRGAGEILLTSIDRDGARIGYDLDLTRAVSSAVCVPVIASGGAGLPAHLSDAILRGGADAVLVAGILHDGLATVAELKQHLINDGIAVRRIA
jgi:cyclase